MRFSMKESSSSNLIDMLDLPKSDQYLNAIFEGALSYDMRLDKVLEQILELAVPGDSLLRLESSNPEFTGLLAIRDGYQVIGAKILKQPISGYEAFRKLMSLADGKVRYQSIMCTDYKLPDTSLQLNLNYILFLYPSLPESPSELLDHAALRDLVFAVKNDEPLLHNLIDGEADRTAKRSFDENDDENWVSINPIEHDKPKSRFNSELQKVVQYEQALTQTRNIKVKQRRAARRKQLAITVTITAVIITLVAGLLATSILSSKSVSNKTTDQVHTSSNSKYPKKSPSGHAGGKREKKKYRDAR
jgi:hypothetical protein